MSETTAPAPSPAPRTLTGTYLSWLQWTQADKAGRTILLNLGLRYGQHSPVIARFVNPPGFGYTAPNAAFLSGVTGFSMRENPTLAADSPLPLLLGPADALAFDVRMRLAEMPGAVAGRTKLQEVEDEVLAAGGAVALELFRSPGHRIDRTDSVEADALRAVDLTEREVADLFTGAAQRGRARAEVRALRRTAVEKVRGKGKAGPAVEQVAAGLEAAVETPPTSVAEVAASNVRPRGAQR